MLERVISYLEHWKVDVIITYADIYSIKFITISNLPYNMLLDFNNVNNGLNTGLNNSFNQSNGYLNNQSVQNMGNNYRYYI